MASDPLARCAAPSPATRRVVVVADSPTVDGSSALRPTDLAVARDGRESGVML
jgi:hypothetical protein